MYSGSKIRGRVGVCFSESGRVRGSTFRGRSPRFFGVSFFFKVKFRIGWCRGWFGFCFSGTGRVRGSNFRGRPPRVSGFWSPEYITNLYANAIIYCTIFPFLAHIALCWKNVESNLLHFKIKKEIFNSDHLKYRGAEKKGIHPPLYSAVFIDLKFPAPDILFMLLINFEKSWGFIFFRETALLVNPSFSVQCTTTMPIRST